MPSFLPHSAFLRKPLSVVVSQHSHETVHPHLTLVDLIMVGVGGTIGSGIFVLSGYIARHYAGPATTLSFALSGMAAFCSGLCYAELSGRIPASGSTYAYAYVALGELPAVLAASCLSLEYVVSGAAVARTWGDKVVLWLRDEVGWKTAEKFLDPGYHLNPMAFLISLVCVLLLLDGIKESKLVTNIFTSLKLALVVFMTVGGFWLLNSSNLHPFVPYGPAGVVRGATSSFFGYLGFDEVCCIAGEAIHPQRDVPRAILFTLSLVAILYVLASLALTGMQPYQEMSDTSAFPGAFRYNGVEWAAQVAAAGEVITLPVVVLISLMAQPRLQLALAKDGLLPEIFGRVDASGNLRIGVAISGSIMVLVATCVPFGYLDDFISAAILVRFSMTNACLLFLRSDRTRLLSVSLVGYSGLCFVTGLLLVHVKSLVASIISGMLTAGAALLIKCKFPRSDNFGGQASNDAHYFEAPCIPLFPCVGIFINLYLVSELEVLGLVLLVLYLGGAGGLYLLCGSRSSRGWNYEGLSGSDPDGLIRSISMPRLETTKVDSRGRNYEGLSGSDPDGLMRSISMPRLETSTVDSNDETSQNGQQSSLSDANIETAQNGERGSTSIANEHVLRSQHTI